MFSKCSRLWKTQASVQSMRYLISSAGDSTLTIQETRKKLKDLVGAQKIWGLYTTYPVLLVVEDLRMNLSRITVLLQVTGNIKDDMNDSGDVAPIATSQDELPIRSMSDSYREAVIPLGTNPYIKEKYINYYKGIRFGRILEDLDTFAVAIGYTHTLDPSNMGKKSPVSIVTGLVDRIEMSEQAILHDRDIKMTGMVTWTGTTSMEVTMDLDQEIDSQWKRLIKAKFLMVARNPTTKGSAIINKLQPNGAEEEELFKHGEENKSQRMLEKQKTLLKTPPSEEERLLIHNMFLQTIDPKANTFKVRVKPENSVWMGDTLLKNLVICMPEQRNLYNKIFGGFLMRKAFELGWANARLYCKAMSHIEVVDDIAFRKPVEVGSLLFLSSQVVYTLGTRVQIKVHAEVMNPDVGTMETTNDFHFTFNTRDKEVLSVLPKTYAESMLYLDGKRHLEQ